ncbi:MAG: tetratricopeptide repeat protein [Alphaproteobacteria bacterium]
MAGVGKAAAVGQLPDQRSMDDLRRLSKLTPLNPQPFLVKAAIALKAGDVERAKRLLFEARRLSPRAPAARYLLADILLREGRIAEGLHELASLHRIVRASGMELVPALAQFAKSPGAARQLNEVLKTNPKLHEPLLEALATDPDNEALVLELAGSETKRADGKPPPWQTRLLEAMIAEKSYERAYALWRRLAGIRAGTRPLLFNGEFRPLSAPPPFNWQFAASGAGFAEPGNGSMRVLYYGRESATLASQLLLLAPGRYRFSAPVAGNPAPGALSWVIGCKGAREPIAQRNLASRSPLDFVVPSDCPAQQLELRGWLQDMPKDSDVRVGPAKLERVGS